VFFSPSKEAVGRGDIDASNVGSRVVLLLSQAVEDTRLTIVRTRWLYAKDMDTLICF
jgi:hypothetical protein